MKAFVPAASRRRPAIVGAIVFVLAIGVLAWRIAAIRGQPAITDAPRTAEQTYLRMIAQHVQTYARTYHRPAYSLDSVVSHLDSANARLMRDLATDPWGQPVQYTWSPCGFTLRSSGGAARADSSGAAGSARWITERHPWPAGAARSDSTCR
jgi:hypothetical protein